MSYNTWSGKGFFNDREIVTALRIVQKCFEGSPGLENSLLGLVEKTRSHIMVSK